MLGGPRALTNGWSISGITRFATGLPVTIVETDDQSLTGTGFGGPITLPVDTPNIIGPLDITDPRKTGGRYFNPLAFGPSALGQEGDADRRFFHGPGINNWDMALLKDTHFTERFDLQFRAEFFNIFNHTQFLTPIGITGFSSGVPTSGSFGIRCRRRKSANWPVVFETEFLARRARTKQINFVTSCGRPHAASFITRTSPNWYSGTQETSKTGGKMAAQGVLAATLVKPGQYEIREYPLPEPASGCVLVKMEMSGICGTDKHTFQGYTTQYGSKKLEFPIIQGHENVGTVAAIGGYGGYTDFEGVPLKVGDRVVVGANVCCGKCYYCRHDFPYYCCEDMTDYGNNLSAKNPPHLFGGWSQYIYIVPGSFLVKVPDELPSEVAVLTEVFAVSVGLDRAKQMSAFPNESFRFDDTVVVLGVGPLGMCFLMKARMLGAGTIIAVDLSEYRLNFAKRLGADHVINAKAASKDERIANDPRSYSRPWSRYGRRMRWRAASGARSTRNAAHRRLAGGGRQLFGSGRSVASARIAIFARKMPACWR